MTALRAVRAAEAAARTADEGELRMRSNLRSVILSEHPDAREACDIPGFARQGESKDLSLCRIEPVDASTPVSVVGGYQPPAVPTAETYRRTANVSLRRRGARCIILYDSELHIPNSEFHKKHPGHA